MAQAKFTTDPSTQPYDAVYERDPRHVAVDAYTTSHLLPSTKRHHTQLENIYQRSLAAGLPDIACTPSQAKFLMLQIQMSNAKHVLEIGTLGGYSAAWMALAGSDVKITTIEIDQQYASIAQENIDAAGLTSQVEIHVGAALDILPKLVSQVRSGIRPVFDFVFIDANKQDNLAYFRHAMSMIRLRGAIVVDNVVRNGKVASAVEAEKDSRVLGTRQLIEAIGADITIEATVIQTVDEKNYDGFLLAVKQA